MGEAPEAAHDVAANRAEAFGIVPVSRETGTLLDHFVELLLPAAQRTNLIARSTIPTVWTRHIADSLVGLARQANKLFPLPPSADPNYPAELYARLGAWQRDRA